MWSKIILISILPNLAPPRLSFRFCDSGAMLISYNGQPPTTLLSQLRGSYCLYVCIIVTRRSQSSTIAPCLGFWIPFRGLWIPGAGFQSFSVERGFWIPCLSGILEYLSSILDSKVLDSGYHEQNFPGFWILQARISQILESGYPYMGRSTSQTFSDLFTLI